MHDAIERLDALKVDTTTRDGDDTPQATHHHRCRTQNLIFNRSTIDSWQMNSPKPTMIQPLLKKHQVAMIVSSRRSLTSAEAYREMDAHLGKVHSPARKPVLRNGRKVWVCC